MRSNYAPKPNSGAGYIAKLTQSTRLSTHGAHFPQNTTDELDYKGGDNDGLE